MPNCISRPLRQWPSISDPKRVAGQLLPWKCHCWKWKNNNSINENVCSFCSDSRSSGVISSVTRRIKSLSPVRIQKITHGQNCTTIYRKCKMGSWKLRYCNFHGHENRWQSKWKNKNGRNFKIFCGLKASSRLLSIFSFIWQFLEERNLDNTRHQPWASALVKSQNLCGDTGCIALSFMYSCTFISPHQ